MFWKFLQGALDMQFMKQRQKWVMVCFSLFFLLLFGVFGGRADQEMQVVLKTLLPVVEGMESAESPVTYFPETLFEYINGAAEIYISYDFKELIVAEYKKNDTSDSVAVEIYDMGNRKNSFGIYSAERYPDSEFLTLGTQGYMEEGTLNFLIGRYYVKLLCFDCQDRSEEWLRAFSKKIVDRVEDRGGFPDILDVFPREGQVPNTEKFILRNVMGYKFLHDGYIASYKTNGLSFDCFILEGNDSREASEMLDKYLEVKGAESVQKASSGFRVKDRYYHNIYLALVDNTICGVMKIPEGSEKIGAAYLEKLINSLKKRQ